MPPPSPPRETFQDDANAEVLNDLDRALIPSTIPIEEENYERIVDSKNFMEDDNFVNTPEFRSFWLREKLKNMCDEEINNFDRNNFDCTPQGGREMVMKRGMLLVPG